MGLNPVLKALRSHGPEVLLRPRRYPQWNTGHATDVARHTLRAAVPPFPAPDAKPYTGKGSYSNWELSADRAKAARRLMQQSGLDGDQVSQVRALRTNACVTQRIRWTRRTGAFRSSCRTPATIPTERNPPGRMRKKSGEGEPSAAGAKAESETTGKKDEK
jgi:hypothetical protein